MSLILKLFVVFGLLTQLLNTVCACSYFWSASDERQFCDASFAIRAVVLEEITENPEIPDWAKDNQDLDPENFIFFYQYKVKVEEVFKKPPSVEVPSTLVAQTPRQPGMCILTLPVGVEILLTGFGDGSPSWESNACSWVQTWSDVTTASQQMLRKGTEAVDCTQRRRPWMLLKLFLICGFLAQLLNTVCACTCFWGASDEKQFCDASFAIRAVVQEEIPQNPEIPEWAKDYPELDPEMFIYFYQYKVKVEEVFKKPPSVDIPSTIVVQTPRQPGMCILTLTVGNEVLLTGFGDGNPAWETNACSWVRSWEEVTAASQEMLRKGIEHVDCTAITHRW